MDLLEAKDAALSYLKTSNREIMKWFRTDITVESKSDQSPVTIADRKAEEVLRKKISSAYPDHGINWRRVWRKYREVGLDMDH